MANTRQVATPQKRRMPVWIKLFPWVTLVLAISLAAASLLLVVPGPDIATERSEHITIATEIVFSVIGFGGGVLFLAGLHGFKFRLKVAYILIAIGAFIYGLGELNVPLITLISAIGLDTFYGLYGGVVFLGLISAISFLIGIHIFGKLINAKAVPKVLVGVLVLMSAMVVMILHQTDTSILTHMKGEAPLRAHDVTNTLMCLYASLMSINAAKILRVKRAAGTAYTNALAWFALACSAQAIATWITMLGLSAQLVHTAFFTTNAFAGAYIFSSFLILKAGYNFTKITNV